MALDFPNSPSNGDYYNGFVYNSTAGAWKIGGLGTLNLTGGNFTGTQSGYKYHIFTTTGTATLTASGSGLCEYLVLAGGGSGGVSAFGGGGGGAGGLLIGSLQLSTGSYTVTVGQGGASVTTSSTVGNNGTDSSIDALVVAKGGGGGGIGSGSPGTVGGSGGGGGTGDTGDSDGGLPFDAYTGVFSQVGPQGHRGGNGQFGTIDRAGGGGGAGSPGNRGDETLWSAVSATDYWVDGNRNSRGGGGGIGLKLNNWLVDVNVITAGSPTVGDLQTDVWYIAGGGGGGVSGATSPASGGYGGGGAGGHDTLAPTNGTDLCGAGGGGSTDNDASGAGGSGLVIVRYVP